MAGRAIGSVVPVARGVRPPDGVDGGGLLRLPVRSAAARMPGRRLANMLLPVPGADEQQVVMPAAAISSARLAWDRPITSCRSGTSGRESGLGDPAGKPYWPASQAVTASNWWACAPRHPERGKPQGRSPADQQGAPCVAAGEHGREPLSTGRISAGQGQPPKFVIEQVFCGYLLGCGENADGDGQVKRAPPWQIGGARLTVMFAREQIAVEQGAAHPIPPFTEVSATHHVEGGRLLRGEPPP